MVLGVSEMHGRGLARGIHYLRGHGFVYRQARGPSLRKRRRRTLYAKQRFCGMV